MRILLLVAGILFSVMAQAEVRHEKSRAGDFYVYIPKQTPASILVIAHGMLGEKEAASDVAQKFLSRWIPYADEHGLLVIAPVFDSPRFGNRGEGYGGYRNLIGKHVGADRFVNDIVDRYSSRTSFRSNRFYLYGHSAGGQFVNRYVVTHPDRVIRAVVSAAGRYSYPTKSASWPYGAGDLVKTVQWKDGTTTKESISKSLASYAQAASKVEIVVGGNDVNPQPARPAHQGTTRIELAQSWAREMNRNAKRYGVSGRIRVHIVPGIGHSSAGLTPYCAEILLRAANG